MKPGKTKSIRTGAFYNWRYAYSIGGIEFFARPKSRANKDILLPARIIGTLELENLRFSLPPVAILTMEIFKKQEIQRTGFQSQNILVEHTIMHSYSIAQNTIITKAETPAPKQETRREEQEMQKLTDHVLKLRDSLFKEIAERITPLSTDATPQQRIAKLQELFNLLKKGGELGVLYEASEGRMPKTPNEVLTPEKDGTRKADCEEFSLLFVAAAKRLNIDVSDIGIGVMKFETENDKGVKKEEMHAAALMVGNDKYVIDPVFGFFQKVSSFEITEIQTLYEGKPIDAGFTIVGMRELEIAGTPEQMAAIHYREAAKHYKDVAKTKSGAANEKELALMGAEVQKGLILDSESKPLRELRYELVHTYLDSAVAEESVKNIKGAVTYALKALRLYGSDEEIITKANNRELDESEKTETHFAFNLRGKELHSHKKYLSAIPLFEKAILLTPKNEEGYGNKISALLGLSDEFYATHRDTAKKYFLEARKTAEEAREHVPNAEEKLKDAFSELDRLGQKTGW